MQPAGSFGVRGGRPRRALRAHVLAGCVSCVVGLSGSASPARVVAEPAWREAAARHRERVHALLRPGLTAADGGGGASAPALDTAHPVFNFLHDYYQFKGPKGVRRISRWTPDPSDSLAAGGVRLAGATPDDVAAGLLHARGATFDRHGAVYDARARFADEPASGATAYVSAGY